MTQKEKQNQFRIFILSLDVTFLHEKKDHT